MHAGGAGRVQGVFVIPESPSVSKQQEFEADIGAIKSVPVKQLSFILRGATLLLSKLAMYENFTGSVSDS